MSTNNYSYKHDVYRAREAYWKRVKNQLQQQELKVKSMHIGIGHHKLDST